MNRLPFEIPDGLRRRAELGEEWAEWLHELPAILESLAQDWDLTWDGEPWHGFASIVAPVQSLTGPAALKVTFPGDDESENEGLALRHWAGVGVVELLRADPHRRALLLERLGNEDLSEIPAMEACAIVASVYKSIHVPALPQLRPITAYLKVWNERLEALPEAAPLPRRLVEQAISLTHDFMTDPASVGTMIHGDLHYANVLAGERTPWIVIDPKPVSGDPHYEVAPLLWNRWEDIAASGNVRGSTRYRFETVVDTAGLDEARARDWVIVRAMHNAMWTIDDASRLGKDIDDAGHHWITQMVSVAKSVQD